MSIVAIVSASWCGAEKVASMVLQEAGLEELRTESVLAEAESAFGIPARKLQRTLEGSRSLFDGVTRSTRRNIAYLRAALAKLIQKDNLLHNGPLSLLLPRSLSHVLRVCLAASREYRVRLATESGIEPDRAARLIGASDENLARFADEVLGTSPWEEKLYDMVIPLDKVSAEDAAREVLENLSKPVVASNELSAAAAADFLLAAKVEVALAEAGHDVDVECRDGKVVLLINRYVMRLEKYKQELAKLALGVEGVKDVEAKTGPKYRQPAIYPALDLPKRVMLVDDEKEFVHTLSERLQTRHFEPVVAYDGEQALQMADSEAPDVMVLDLKMPGIDGLEVLRRIKKKHPATEVIILTGHGSEAERKAAMELGAFAYLNKPVDVDLLANTMRNAYQRVAESQQQKNGEEGGEGG